jgi:hypothetical protein
MMAFPVKVQGENMKRAAMVGAVLCGFILGAAMGHLTPVQAQFLGQSQIYIDKDTSPRFPGAGVPIAGSHVVGFSCVVTKDDDQTCYIASTK